MEPINKNFKIAFFDELQCIINKTQKGEKIGTENFRNKIVTEYFKKTNDTYFFKHYNEKIPFNTGDIRKIISIVRE